MTLSETNFVHCAIVSSHSHVQFGTWQMCLGVSAHISGCSKGSQGARECEWAAQELFCLLTLISLKDYIRVEQNLPPWQKKIVSETETCEGAYIYTTGNNTYIDNSGSRVPELRSQCGDQRQLLGASAQVSPHHSLTFSSIYHFLAHGIF